MSEKKEDYEKFYPNPPVTPLRPVYPPQKRTVQTGISSKALWILFIGIVTGSLAIIMGACISAL